MFFCYLLALEVQNYDLYLTNWNQFKPPVKQVKKNSVIKYNNFNSAGLYDLSLVLGAASVPDSVSVSALVLLKAY